MEVRSALMNMRIYLLGIAAACYVHSGHGDPIDSEASEVGVVTEVRPGTLYIAGFAHAIALVDTAQGPKRVAVPSIGVLQSIQVGESLVFSGPNLHLADEPVVNTSKGFVYRAAEKSMAAYLAEQIRVGQEQAQRMRADAAKTGIPNAIPTFVQESSQQARERTANRRTDILLWTISFIVALLAIERLPALAVRLLRWLRAHGIRRRSKSRT